MAGTDDQPDNEGPGPEPDPDSGPDDGPTPDDADPPVPDDDGEPGPDDEGDPPDDGQPGRREGQRERSRLEVVNVTLSGIGIILTAAAFIVGSIFSYKSVKVSIDSAVIARDTLADARHLQEVETLKDLSRISYDVRLEGGQATLEVTNGSSRPFGLFQLAYQFTPEDQSETIAIIASFTGDPDAIAVTPCTRVTLAADSPGSILFQTMEPDKRYISRSLSGVDLAGSGTYVVGIAGAHPVERVSMAVDSASRVPVYLTLVSKNLIEGC